MSDYLGGCLKAIRLVLSSLIVVVLTSTALAGKKSSPSQQMGKFPLGPEPSMTVGSLCDTPDTFRYPEHIAYCERDVDTQLKWDIIRAYDQEFGYHIEETGRQNFKIDHYIPLCAGGSNKPDNLWPQHKSVYVVTDDLEAEVCAKMSAGRLKQSEAVQFIIRAKNNLDEAPEILAQVRAR